MRKPISIALAVAASAIVLFVATGALEPQGEQVVRGYFRLGQRGPSVHVKSDADALVHLMARNNGPADGGLNVETSYSQFHLGTLDPEDAMVLDLPSETGMDLGTIGIKANEVLELSQAYGSRVTVFVTVQTAGFATVEMY